MEKVYKVRSYVQHISTKNIFRITYRRGLFNCHYSLKWVHGSFGQQMIGMVSGSNLDEFYTVLDSRKMRILYGKN